MDAGTDLIVQYLVGKFWDDCVLESGDQESHWLAVVSAIGADNLELLRAIADRDDGVLDTEFEGCSLLTMTPLGARCMEIFRLRRPDAFVEFLDSLAEDDMSGEGANLDGDDDDLGSWGQQ
jgi:hypothetical protein